MLVSGVKLRPPSFHNQEVIQMKMLILGSNAMNLLASAMILMTPENSADLIQFLLSMIGGTVGCSSFLAIYGTKTAQEIAAKMTGSASLAAFVAPFLMDQCVTRFGLDPNFKTLIFISGTIGFGGPYLILKYGQSVADMMANWGLTKAKDAVGMNQK